MEKDANDLAHIAVRLLEKTDQNRRLLIGISGIPASGKSTFAALLTERINRLLKTSHNADANQHLKPSLGWHLTRAQLDVMPDPKLAHDRRGAHWTFDSEGYVAFVRLLKEEILSSKPVIMGPSFDHAMKDPGPNTVFVQSFHRIVIIEGLYTFLSIDPWKEAGLLLDERWLFQIELEEATRRLVKRHVITGVAKDMKEAIWRAEENDMPNGRFLLANSLEPTRIISSKDDIPFPGVSN
ncbi:hypothetical protein M378DRAFT_166421 [Amanita muscaria Koide BX008]|uniref:Phosphoribulokinase/uridine kinase domain-containing protein n=1 Tax=Amanita muscaria (strain Koide BX008) TaxID=946122 RepID=A0A0C2SFD3_AMAMK|nr:hypothetical protein M378DRAFT_166421 [Amanita muscaria Koide BX008]